MTHFFEIRAARRYEIGQGEGRKALHLLIERLLFTTRKAPHETRTKLPGQSIKQLRQGRRRHGRIFHTRREGLAYFSELCFVDPALSDQSHSPFYSCFPFSRDPSSVLLDDGVPEHGRLPNLGATPGDRANEKLPSMLPVHQPPEHHESRRGLKPPSPHRLSWLILIVGAALLYSIGLGANDLWAPDEPRYAAIAEELRSFRHGVEGLFLLHLNDVPYTQKPPLYFWLAAALGQPFDRVTEIAARLPSVIAGIGSVALTAWIGMLLFRRGSIALFGAALLATSFRFAFSARRAQLDVLLTGFELLAIALFLVLETRRGGIEHARQSPLVITGLHAALGAAALVKGPVAWLPLLVMAAYLGWEGRIRALIKIMPPWSWLLSIGPLAIWALVAVVLAPDGFAKVAFGENLLGRFFAGTSHPRPLYYYLYQLPLDFLPWSLLLPTSIPVVWGLSARDESQGQSDGRRRSARFLIVWILIPFIFFSLSAGKRGLYLLPFFPALALICALIGPSRPVSMGFPARMNLRRWALLVGGVALLELGIFSLALPHLQAEKSPRPIAIAAARHTPEGERLGVFDLSPIEGAIPYYGGPSVAALRTTDDLRRFLAEGGHVMLLRARHFEEWGKLLGLREVRSFRTGRRRLILAEVSQ